MQLVSTMATRWITALQLVGWAKSQADRKLPLKKLL
jgi:hypothetical protein